MFVSSMVLWKKSFAIFLAFSLLQPLLADSTEAWSDEFSFDVRDPAGMTERESGVFSMDARDLGNSASSASGVFAFATQSGTLSGLTINSAPTSVTSGVAAVFPAGATFSGSGGMTDVSTNVKWFVVGNAPDGTRFEGNKLIAGSVTVPTVIKVNAVFVFASGSREAVPVEVTIHPATPGYTVRGWYDAPQPVQGGTYMFHVSFHATTVSPQGAASPQNMFWDLDGDGDFDDDTGNDVVKEDLLAGQTVRIGVRAEWPLGVEPPASAADYFFVTLDYQAVANEPPVSKVVDTLNGSFLDSDGNVFTPSASRKANGLVIVTHGLWGSGHDIWPGEMRDAILTRLVSSQPNVAIYDWERMADPTAYRSNGQTNGAAQWAAFKIDDAVLIRPYGKAQGAMVADWVERQRQLGNVDRNAKLHLIGHSAGGFVMGEAARLLNQRSYSQIQVTMLDTPLPYHEHINPAWRTERYISSWIGGNPETPKQVDGWNLAALACGSRLENFLYQRPAAAYVLGPLATLVPGEVKWIPRISTGPKYYRTVINPHGESLEDQHTASHEYYTATINSTMLNNSTWLDDVVGDGFNQSFLVNSADFAPSGPQTIPAPNGNDPQPAPPYVPPMEDLSTFGQVNQTGPLYQVSEQANAGVFKTFTLPTWAATLQFNLRVSTPGDGDFVTVHWNDGDALAIIPETALAYDAPLQHEIDLTGLGGQTGTLTIKLNSRGAANSVVEISDVRILENDDLDGDGLSNTAELAEGSDPLEIDSDGDGLTDNDEVLTYGISPVKSDTDDDGQGDASELAAGTSPQNPQSRFAAAMGSVVPGVSAPVFWNGAAGRSYRVVRTLELGTLNIDFIGAGLEGTNGTMSFEDHAPPADRAFYWIEVE